MLIPIAVIAHIRALRRHLCVLQRHHAVSRRTAQDFHRIQRLAHIAAACRCNVFAYRIACLRMRLTQRKAAPYRRNQIHRLQRFEFKHRASTQDCVIDIKIRIFRRRRNQGNASILDELQQRLLLFLIKILDLIQIYQRAIGRNQRSQLVKDLTNIRSARRCGVQPIQLSAGFTRDNGCHCGFANAGWTIKNHIGNRPALNDAAQQSVLTKNMRLTDHIPQRVRANPVGQRLIHSISSLFFSTAGTACRSRRHRHESHPPCSQN